MAQLTLLTGAVHGRHRTVAVLKGLEAVGGAYDGRPALLFPAPCVPAGPGGPVPCLSEAQTDATLIYTENQDFLHRFGPSTCGMGHA
jgi:hypothetical protein